MKEPPKGKRAGKYHHPRSSKVPRFDEVERLLSAAFDSLVQVIELYRSLKSGAK